LSDSFFLLRITSVEAIFITWAYQALHYYVVIFYDLDGEDACSI